MLEDLLDLSDERRDLGTELLVVFGGSKEVQELLADEVVKGILRAELVLDAASRFTLLDPYFAEIHYLTPLISAILPSK